MENLKIEDNSFEKDKILPQIGSCIPSELKNMYYSYENIVYIIILQL